MEVSEIWMQINYINYFVVSDYLLQFIKPRATSPKELTREKLSEVVNFALKDDIIKNIKRLEKK